MQYQRTISEKIKALSKQFPVIALTGARQVGKTTLLRELFPDYNYISLDLPSIAEAAETESLNFLKKYPSPLIIDEVQYAPELFRTLKNQIDKNRHWMGQYILTGSQKFPLMKEVSESLAGRVGLLELETLSLKEIGTQTDWDLVLSRGMYPELWRQPQMNAYDFYSSYVATYLERDIRQLLNVNNLRDFERFLRAAAARSGQLLNRSDLSRDVGVSSKTIGEWIGVLQASNQIFILEPYFENVGKRLIKSPKLYFHDTGLLCFLLGLDAASLTKSPMIGSIWETFVYSELRKQKNSSLRQGQSLWFYRNAEGMEMDFLRIHHSQIDFIECKWAERPDSKWFKPMKQIFNLVSRSKSQNPGQLSIVCRTDIAYQNENISIINPNELS